MGQSYSVLSWPKSMSGPNGLRPTFWPIFGLCGHIKLAYIWAKSHAISVPHCTTKAIRRLMMGPVCMPTMAPLVYAWALLGLDNP